MISSAIWDKSAQVNFSGLTKFAVFFFTFTSADLSQIAREKSCGYLLNELLFLFYVSPHITVPRFPPTNDNHDQEWSKFWQANIGVFVKKILILFFCFSWQTTFWWIALHCDPRRKNPGTVWCNLQVYLQERRWCMNKSCSLVHWLNSIQKKVPRVN